MSIPTDINIYGGGSGINSDDLFKNYIYYTKSQILGEHFELIHLDDLLDIYGKQVLYSNVNLDIDIDTQTKYNSLILKNQLICETLISNFDDLNIDGLFQSIHLDKYFNDYKTIYGIINSLSSVILIIISFMR